MNVNWILPATAITPSDFGCPASPGWTSKCRGADKSPEGRSLREPPGSRRACAPGELLISVFTWIGAGGAEGGGGGREETGRSP